MNRITTSVAKLSRVCIVLLVMTGLCFMTMACHAKQKPSLEVTAEKTIRAQSFAEFYAQLDEETKLKLMAPVEVAWKQGKAEQILLTISGKTGVNLSGHNLNSRHDLIYKDVPAGTILEEVSLNQKWTWEKEGNAIRIYPFRSEADIEAVNTFFDGLDAGTKEKLRTPATLVYQDAKADMIFQGLSKQTGCVIVSKDINDHVDCIFEKTAAMIILKTLARAYGWKFHKVDEYILAMPAQNAQQALSESFDNKKQIVVECRLLEVSSEADKSWKDQIEEYSHGKRKEVTPEICNEWISQKGVEIRMAPRMVVLDGMDGTFSVNHVEDSGTRNILQVTLKPIWKNDENITIEELNGTVFIDGQVVPFEGKNLAQKPGKAYLLKCLNKARESWYLIITLSLNTNAASRSS